MQYSCLHKPDVTKEILLGITPGFLCGLHKVWPHYDVIGFIYLSTRVERLSGGLLNHTCTHCRCIFFCKMLKSSINTVEAEHSFSFPQELINSSVFAYC